MVTVIQSNGTIIKTQPDRVYQGSNNVNQVVLVGAFAQNLIPQIAFKLPQTGTYTAFDFMTSADIPTGTGLSAWTYDIPLAVTQEYGQVDFQIQVEDINGNIVASGLCSFEVERGVPPDTSSIPDLEPLETIKQIIQSIQGDIANGWLMSKGILPYDLTFEYPLNAIVFDTNSKNMFLSLQANNKGNALSDSAYWQDLGTYTGLQSQITANGQLIAQNTQNITANTQAIEQLQEDVASIESFEIQIVSELPPTGKSNIMYLVPIPGETAYEEYVWLASEQRFELIGTTRVDLSDYYTKGQTDTLLSAKANQTDLQSLQNIVGENSSDITDLQSSVETLSQGLSTAESNITTLQGEVATNTEDIAINTSDIDNINQELPNKADVSTVTNLQSQVNAISEIAESSVLFTPQTLTAEQQAQVRSNIGAGSSGFSGSYDDLSQKPIINADLDALLPTSAISNQLYRHTGTSAETYNIGMLYLVVGSAWQEYIPTQASQVGALATTDVLNSPSQSTTQVYSAKYVQDNFTPRTFVENLYLTRTNTTTADLTNAKPVANTNNFITTTTTNTSFDFASTTKFVLTRTLQNNVQFDKQDALKVTLNCAFNRNTTVEFGARILMNGTPISSNQAFGLTSFNGDTNYDQVTEFTLTIVMDLLATATTYPIGTIMTVEIFTRQVSNQSLITRIFCGVNVNGVDRNSYANLNFTATSIDTNQIADGAITTEKLADNAVTQQKIDGLTATIEQLNYSSNVTSDIQTQINGKENAFTKNTAFNKNFSTTNPLVNGTASAGTSNTVARGDHVHPTDTNLQGQIATNANNISSLQTSVSNKANLTGGNNFTGTQNISGTSSTYTEQSINFNVDGSPNVEVNLANSLGVSNSSSLSVTGLQISQTNPSGTRSVTLTPSTLNVTTLGSTGFNFIAGGSALASMSSSGFNFVKPATFAETVSDCNSVSQAQYTTAIYNASNTANAPVQDSGILLQVVASSSYIAQMFIANDENCTTWRRNYRAGTWQEWKQMNTKKDDILIYDMDSEDENVNRGFTSGMKGTNYIQLDFSQYKSIRIYARLYTSNCVQEIPVKNRKVAQTAMVVTGSNPIIISSLNILFTIEPLLNSLQVGAYGKYTFSSETGTFTLESGASNDNFYVYRIEGIV